MLVTIFFCFVSQGIFFWYFSLFGTEVRHYSLIANGANYQPASVLGAAAAFLVAWLLPRMAARRLIAIGASALVLCNILMATAPEDLSYWAMMFPAMSVASFAIALIYPAAQVIATNSVATQDQGIAGSLISILLGYGLSIGIGMAGTVDRYTKRGHGSLVYGHRCAFYFAVALASVGLAGALLLRMPKPAIESWVGDEMKEVVQYDSEQSSPVDEMRPALYAN
jgi:MFS family permease